MQQEESTMFIQSFLYKRNGSSDTYIVSSCFFSPTISNCITKSLLFIYPFGGCFYSSRKPVSLGAVRL